MITDRTFDALQRIDANKFEDLVAYYLRRKRDSSLMGLIQTGVNDAGRFVNGPVDGLYMHHLVPVGFAATTENRNGLRGKWLGEGIGANRQSGDIEKAATFLQSTPSQAVDGASRGTLYLATNLPLSGVSPVTKTGAENKDVRLQRDASAKGNDLGINVEFVEATQLIDFLDNTPEGQYIRWRIFGIDADLLSLDLLRKIADISIQKHSDVFSLLKANYEIQREIEGSIEAILRNRTAARVGVIGRSGTGKSKLLNRVGRSLLALGTAAIWLPAEALDGLNPTLLSPTAK